MYTGFPLRNSVAGRYRSASQSLMPVARKGDGIFSTLYERHVAFSCMRYTSTAMHLLYLHSSGDFGAQLAYALDCLLRVLLASEAFCDCLSCRFCTKVCNFATALLRVNS